MGAERMSEKIGKASLRDAAIGTGVAVDKMLALTGQTPTVQIANLIKPTEAEREERRAVHARLDAIARKLMEPEPRKHGARIACSAESHAVAFSKRAVKRLREHKAQSA
jgi:hypothetical protein